MIPYALWLQYLLCMNPAVGLTYDFVTSHAMTLDCKKSLRTANRVCHDGILTDQDVVEMKDHFQDRFFSWFVDVNDYMSREILLKNRMHFRCSFSFCVKNLDNLYVQTFDPGIMIQEIFDHEQILGSWIECAIIAFHPANATVLLDKNTTFLKHLLSKKSQAVHFYFGYFQGQPACTCMSIYHDDVVGLYRLGTLPEFQRKGIGSAMLQQVLLDAKLKGCKQAILIATDAGKSLSEHFGFIEYAKYHVYSNVV